jgi:hypothetical protein
MGKELKKFKLEEDSWDYTKKKKDKGYHKNTSKRSDPNRKNFNRRRSSRND